jgi:hypothetical protein
METDSHKVARTAAIARFARFIERNLYHTDWTFIADVCGVSNILNRHERVRRAQGFGDDDYTSAISAFLKDVFNENDEWGLLLINEIINPDNHRQVLSEEIEDELKNLLSMFSGESKDLTFIIQNIQPSRFEQYISVSSLPDDFYKSLISEINQLYARRLPMSLSVLIRKLLENLIIEILRKRYNTSELELYYDTGKRRFHDFSVLVKNLNEKVADFHHITPNLEKSLKDINEYRETGNAGAHSIDAYLTIEQFRDGKDEINYLVQLLLRILQNI